MTRAGRAAICGLALWLAVPFVAPAQEPAKPDAEASEQPEPPKKAPRPRPDTTNLETPAFPDDYRLGDAFRIRLGSRFLPAARFDGFEADLYEPSLRIQATIPLSRRAVLQASGRFLASLYDVDGSGNFFGRGQSIREPFDRFYRTSLSLQGAFLLNPNGGGFFVEDEMWSILANAFGRSRWESGNFSDGASGGGGLALGYEIEGRLRIAIGVGIQSKLVGGGVSVDPFASIRWNVTDALTVRNRGRGLQIEYRVHRKLELFVAGFYEGGKYRLSQRAGLPNDLSFRDKAVQAGAGFEWRAAKFLRVNVEAGAVAWRELRVKSEDLGTLAKLKSDPSAYLELRFQFRP
jgi:hypothetical protein